MQSYFWLFYVSFNPVICKQNTQTKPNKYTCKPTKESKKIWLQFNTNKHHHHKHQHHSNNNNNNNKVLATLTTTFAPHVRVLPVTVDMAVLGSLLKLSKLSMMFSTDLKICLAPVGMTTVAVISFYTQHHLDC